MRDLFSYHYRSSDVQIVYNISSSCLDVTRNYFDIPNNNLVVGTQAATDSTA
jgi:hypothetical protein